jgi:zinc protease
VATETLFELLHDRHRIRRWRIGREPGLRALTRESMLRFYRNFYHPGNTVLVVVGDVDPDEAMAEIVARYGELPAGTPARIPGPTEEGSVGFRHREWSGDIGQTQITFGWRTPPTLDDATPGLDLLGTILGSGRASRLYRAVREKKLASAVSAYDYTPTSIGVFVIHAESPAERAAEAARAIWAQVRDIRENGVTEVELTRAKRVYEARWIRRLEDMEGQANYLAEWEALGDWTMGDDYLRRALAVTTDEIQALATAVPRPGSGGSDRLPAEGRRRGRARRGIDARAARRRPPAVAEPAEVAPLAAPAIVTGLRAEREEGGVHVFRTETGIPVLVRRKPGALVHAGVYVLGGGRDEPPANAGLTSLLVRAALKGTTRRTALQIAEEAELLGGTVTGTRGRRAWLDDQRAARHAPQSDRAAADVRAAMRRSRGGGGHRAARSRWADLVAPARRHVSLSRALATQAAFAGIRTAFPPAATSARCRRSPAAMLRDWHRERASARGRRRSPSWAMRSPRSWPGSRRGVSASCAAGESRPSRQPEWPDGARAARRAAREEQTALALMFAARHAPTTRASRPR